MKCYRCSTIILSYASTMNPRKSFSIHSKRQWSSPIFSRPASGNRGHQARQRGAPGHAYHCHVERVGRHDGRQFRSGRAEDRHQRVLEKAFQDRRSAVRVTLAPTPPLAAAKLAPAATTGPHCQDNCVRQRHGLRGGDLTSSCTLSSRVS